MNDLDQEDSAKFMKKPCQHCPYRSDVKPFLTPSRGEELAFLAQNPYASFSCHKTLEYDDEGEGNFVSDKSKECAGFLTLMAQELGEDEIYECKDTGFQPSYSLVYSDSSEMAEAYGEAAG